jgi:hypothetical protein
MENIIDNYSNRHDQNFWLVQTALRLKSKKMQLGENKECMSPIVERIFCGNIETLD